MRYHSQVSPPDHGNGGVGREKSSRIKNCNVLLINNFCQFIFLNCAQARTLLKTLSMMDTLVAGKIP